MFRVYMAIICAGFPMLVASAHEPQVTTYEYVNETTLTIPDKKPIEGYQRFRYRLPRKDNILQLVIDESQVKASFDNITMNRNGMIVERFGIRKEFKLDEVPPEMQESLTQTFGQSLCSIEVDKSGNELNRKLTEKQQEIELVKAGCIDACMFFQPPFDRNEIAWKAPMVLGNSGPEEVRGEVTYEKRAGPLMRTPVSVVGRWKSDSKDKEGYPLVAETNIKGELVYDCEVGEWVEGKIEVVMTRATKDEAEKGTSSSMKQVHTLKSSRHP